MFYLAMVFLSFDCSNVHILPPIHIRQLIFFAFFPFQKHPHVIFESHSKSNTGCANKNIRDRPLRGSTRKPKHTNSFFNFSRQKRDVREATKYVETALIVDRAMVSVCFHYNLYSISWQYHDERSASIFLEILDVLKWKR